MLKMICTSLLIAFTVQHAVAMPIHAIDANQVDTKTMNRYLGVFDQLELNGHPIPGIRLLSNRTINQLLDQRPESPHYKSRDLDLMNLSRKWRVTTKRINGTNTPAESHMRSHLDFVMSGHGRYRYNGKDVAVKQGDIIRVERYTPVAIDGKMLLARIYYNARDEQYMPNKGKRYQGEKY